MQRTRKLLCRPAGNVDANRKDAKNRGDRDSEDCCRSSSATVAVPSLTCGHNHGDSHNGRSSDNKKWSQKLVESKVFKRLMQPAHGASVDDGHRRSTSRGTKESDGQDLDCDGVNSDYDAPRLGEIPVRSKYHLPDQEKSHFTNHPTYLPLAEQCGPPQRSSFTPLTSSKGHHQQFEQSNNESSEVGHHAHSHMSKEAKVRNNNQQAQQMSQESFHGSGRVVSLREGVVKGIEGSWHSIRSNTSGVSSVGPTGLALMPQFRWIPKQGGGGLGFNPFVQFRCQPQPVGGASMYPAPETGTPAPSSDAQQADVYRTPELPRGTISPERQQQREVQSSIPGRNNRYFVLSTSPSTPPAQQSVSSNHPHRETGALSFYGPIGSIGIATSSKRRAVEQQSGMYGKVERAYKERTSGRAVGEDVSIQLLTQLWCDVNLLRAARVVDSPRLPSDDGEDGDSARGASPSISSADGEVDEAAMTACEEKVRQRRQQQCPARSPSFYFRDDDLAALRVEDNGEGSLSAVAAQAAAACQPATVPCQHQQRKSPSVVKAGTCGAAVPEVASSSSSGRSSNDSSDASNSDGSSAGEHSAAFGLDVDDDESSGSGDADSPRRNGTEAAGDSTHQHSWKKRSSISASPGMGRSMLGDGQYDFMISSVMDVSRMLGGGEAAATANHIPNCAPCHAKVQSAEISTLEMTPQSKEHRGTTTPAARGSTVRPGSEGTAAALVRRGQCLVSNATDTRAPSASALRLASHQESDAAAPSRRNDAGRCADHGLEEQFAYGSTFSMDSRRNSYLATTCGEAPNAAFMPLGAYGVGMHNGYTANPGTSVAVGDGEASVTMGVYRDSRSNTVSPGAFGVMSRGLTVSPAAGGGSIAHARSTISQLPTLPSIDRGSTNSATSSRPPSTAQSLRVPAASTSPHQRTRTAKIAYPDGCLAPITPPITPTAGSILKHRRPRIDNSTVSIPCLSSSTNVSVTPGLGDIAGGKSYTSLASELPAI